MSCSAQSCAYLPAPRRTACSNDKTNAETEIINNCKNTFWVGRISRCQNIIVHIYVYVSDCTHRYLSCALYA